VCALSECILDGIATSGLYRAKHRAQRRPAVLRNERRDLPRRFVHGCCQPPGCESWPARSARVRAGTGQDEPGNSVGSHCCHVRGDLTARGMSEHDKSPEALRYAVEEGHSERPRVQISPPTRRLAITGEPWNQCRSTMLQGRESRRPRLRSEPQARNHQQRQRFTHHRATSTRWYAGCARWTTTWRPHYGLGSRHDIPLGRKRPRPAHAGRGRCCGSPGVRPVVIVVLATRLVVPTVSVIVRR
jgi:hypothetical protein